MNPLVHFDPCNEATQLVFVLTQFELCPHSIEKVKSKYITKKGSVQSTNQEILKQIGYNVESTTESTRITKSKQETNLSQTEPTKNDNNTKGIIVIGPAKSCHISSYTHNFGDYTIVYEF
jgi:hypothetical protein